MTFCKMLQNKDSELCILLVSRQFTLKYPGINWMLETPYCIISTMKKEKYNLTKNKTMLQSTKNCYLHFISVIFKMANVCNALYYRRHYILSVHYLCVKRANFHEITYQGYYMLNIFQKTAWLLMKLRYFTYELSS